MSNNAWSSTPTMPKLEKVELEGSPKVVITNEFLQKVQYLCKNINKVEWSGILFYEMKGSMRKATSVVITCKDILLMDKGSSAYTEYNWDEDVVAYRMDNPEAIDWLVGHIHSHNTMNVFFSGTDTDELNDNCPNHNMYLSLIVNNFMEMKAKIAFTALSNNYTCKDENGKDYTLKVTGNSVHPLMFIYDCEIEKPETTIVVSEQFSNRLKEIEEKSTKKAEVEARKKEFEKKPIVSPMVGSSKPSKHFNDFSRNKLSDDYDWRQDKSWEKDEDILEVDNSIFQESLLEDEFVCFVLRLGNTIKDDDIIDALDDLERSEIKAESIIASILAGYSAYYENFFDKIEGYNGYEAYGETLQYFIDRLKEEKDDYDFLPTVIKGLEKFKDELIKETLK